LRQRETEGLFARQVARPPGCVRAFEGKGGGGPRPASGLRAPVSPLRRFSGPPASPRPREQTSLRRSWSPRSAVGPSVRLSGSRPWDPARRCNRVTFARYDQTGQEATGDGPDLGFRERLWRGESGVPACST
jgi:hypothetical protein